jgi:hypothetical protein
VATPPSSSRQVAAFTPAAVGFGLFAGVVQIRMQEPWADGVLLVVAAATAILLLALGLRAESRADMTVLLVGGLAFAAVTIGRLADVLAGDDFLSGGGTLTWMLVLFTALGAALVARTRSMACLLVTALAAVGLLLEAVDWIFDTEDVDTYRALLAVSFAVLFGAGLAIGNRAGTILVGAAGVTVIAAYYVTGFGIFPGGGLGWGWELVTLAQGLALLVYAARQVEPGPGYLAFFVLALFVFTAAAAGEEVLIINGSEPEEPSPSLVGWPLALAVGTALAALWGLRGARRQTS